MNKQQIEEAITSTLVIENKQSIHLAVDKILALSQPKDVEEIRKEFEYQFEHIPYNYIDGILNFFIPYLQPQQSDAVEFAEWIAKEGIKNGCPVSSWHIIKSHDEIQHFTTEELYQQFKERKQ